jgi:putative FmdB family regulatory protein
MLRVRPSSLSFVSMPTYDYRCPNGHDFEHFFRKISDAQAEFVCPVCGAVAQRRMSKGAGLVFKGSGFYLTDYGRNAHRTSGPDSSGGDSKSESKSQPSGGDGAAPGKSEPATKDGAATSAAGPKPESKSSEAKSQPTKTAKSTESKPSSGKSKGGSSE